VPTVYARTLRRAADLVGGELELAARLDVAPRDLTLWFSGSVQPPMHVFLKAVDIVVDGDVLGQSNR
jgi:DNA-binding transcriptional regulator YdaS (Cro superfamily)